MATKTTKRPSTHKRRVERVEDIDTAYRESLTIGHQKPIAIDEKEHKRLTQKRAIPPLRDIAKWLASALPLEGEDFGEQVSATERELLAMTKRKRDRGNLIALQTAFIFSHKVPRQERPDMFQDIFCILFSKGCQDNGIAYAVARADWVDWWQAYKIRSHYSLDEKVKMRNGKPMTEGDTYGDLLVGVCDFEMQMIGKIDGDRLLEALPTHIRKLVQRRLEGHSLTGGDAKMLNKWVNSRPTILAQYTLG